MWRVPLHFIGIVEIVIMCTLYFVGIGRDVYVNVEAMGKALAFQMHCVTLACSAH